MVHRTSLALSDLLRAIRTDHQLTDNLCANPAGVGIPVLPVLELSVVASDGYCPGPTGVLVGASFRHDAIR